MRPSRARQYRTSPGRIPASRVAIASWSRFAARLTRSLSITDVIASGHLVTRWLPDGSLSGPGPPPDTKIHERCYAATPGRDVDNKEVRWASRCGWWG